jgi:hypothetical protein
MYNKMYNKMYTECCDIDISDKTLDVYFKIFEDTVNYNYSNALDLINFNIFICLFLLACILSFLCRQDKKYKKYVAINTVEPKLTNCEIINIKQ